VKKLCLRSGVLAAVAGRRAPNVDFGDSVSCVGGVPYQNPAAWQDDNGHGTHTAGTIAAAKNGPGGDSILQLTAAAPNGRVLSTWPAGFPCTRKVVDVSGATYCYLQGTSMASPHAAGVAALIESRGITSPGAVAARLEATADPLACPADLSIYAFFPAVDNGAPQVCTGGTPYNSFNGHGQINALAAVGG